MNMEWVEFTRFIKDVCSIALPLKYSIFPFLHEKKVQTANRLVCTLFDNGRIIPFGRSGWCNTIQQEDFKLLGFSFEMDAIPQGGYLNPIAKTVDDFAADVNFSCRRVGFQPSAGVYRVADCGEIHAHFGADVAHYRTSAVDANAEGHRSPKLFQQFLRQRFGALHYVKRCLAGVHHIIFLLDRGVPDRHGAVPHKLVQCSMIFHDAVGGECEIAIENRYHLLWREDLAYRERTLVGQRTVCGERTFAGNGYALAFSGMVTEPLPAMVTLVYWFRYPWRSEPVTAVVMV